MVTASTNFSGQPACATSAAWYFKASEGSWRLELTERIWDALDYTENQHALYIPSIYIYIHEICIWCKYTHIYTYIYIGFMPLGSNSKSSLGLFKPVLGLGIPTNLHLPRLLLGGGYTPKWYYVNIYIWLYMYISIFSDQTWISIMVSSFNKRCFKKQVSKYT